MLSHGNLLANAQHNLVATGHRAGQRWLHVCPMFHVAGIANLLACTWAGAEQVLLPRFDAAAVLETIERERITTPCSCRRCSGCCSTRRARTTPT
jgi:acyl-CoA synthetase (AMP-forming)/AMP-acid ligase II